MLEHLLQAERPQLQLLVQLMQQDLLLKHEASGQRESSRRKSPTRLDQLIACLLKTVDTARQRANRLHQMDYLLVRTRLGGLPC